MNLSIVTARNNVTKLLQYFRYTLYRSTGINNNAFTFILISKENLKKMKEKDLKCAYNNVLSQTISSSQRYLFAGNLFGDIFVLRLVKLDSVDCPKVVDKYFIFYITLQSKRTGQEQRGATRQAAGVSTGQRHRYQLPFIPS